MPKLTAALCLPLLLAGALAAGDDPEPKARAVQPREIAVAGLPRVNGQYDKPISIPSERHLAELVPNEQTRRAILKQVNFEKERLLLFCWFGSPRDSLVPAKSKAGEANFEITRAPAKKAVLQARLFAVPARAKVKVTEKAE